MTNTPNDHSAPPVLECRAITKTFHDGTRDLHVLRGIDLCVEENKTLAISGMSGAGKSTLLQIMGSLDRPTAGQIMYRDVALTTMSGSAINRLRNEDLGFVFQFYHLLPEFTALENVMMPAMARGARRASCRERAEDLLATVGLKDRINHKPPQLSGGEQQRAAIARALFNDPAVILADEPTGNLDEHTGAGIVDLLFDLNETKGITLVLVTHDLQLARRAHTWVELREGLAEIR